MTDEAVHSQSKLELLSVTSSIIAWCIFSFLYILRLR